MLFSKILYFSNKVLNLFYPNVCSVCQQRVEGVSGICQNCFSSLEYVTDNDVQHVSVVYYDEISKKLLLDFKYADKPDLAILLGRLMVNATPEIFKDIDIITGVPIHWKRLLFRKYNQAILLAKKVADITEIPVDAFLLKRIKYTFKQTSKSARFENVKNAFAFNSKKDIKGKRILLVDDVYTTGATMNACAKLLMKNGAKEVRFLTFAKAKPVD